LGVDINCPAHSRVYAPFDCEVVNVYADPDREMGWGGRVTLYRGGYYVILGHLESLALPKLGTIVRQGDPISLVGTWPYNGNTFNHLHVQVGKKHDVLYPLDGYGTEEDLTRWFNPFTIDL
jgi:murein DD-endopeptidase MepM/ murein hydrolase activator NlpD